MKSMKSVTFDSIDSIEFGTLIGGVLQLVRIWPIFDSIESIESIEFGTLNRGTPRLGPKFNGINGIKKVPISLILVP